MMGLVKIIYGLIEVSCHCSLKPQYLMPWALAQTSHAAAPPFGIRTGLVTLESTHTNSAICQWTIHLSIVMIPNSNGHWSATVAA